MTCVPLCLCASRPPPLRAPPCTQDLLSANSSLKAVLQQRDSELQAQQERLEAQEAHITQQGYELDCSDGVIKVGVSS